MTVQTDAAAAPTPPTPAPPAPTPAPPASAQPAAPAPTQPPAEPAPAGKVEDLPDWAQKIITDARADAGKARTTGKQQAADEARIEMARVLAKAAGIELPGEKPDPEKLAADLAAANTTSRQAALELAIYRTAASNGGNPDSLLDSRAFLATVQNLDPTAADFAAQVGAAVKTAIAVNPLLKAGRAPGASSVEITGGSGGDAQITEDQLKGMTAEQIVDAQNKGLLRNLGVGPSKPQ